jgi:hypothetical protein
MFHGLVNRDALDFAQLGRNLSQGRGLVTYIIRPLAITGKGTLFNQPDTVHGPLYPFLLSLAFGVLTAKEYVAAGVSAVFFLLTVPLVYILGTRVFSRAVGLLTAIIFTVNSLMLEYAASGLHITLYVFLTTALLLVVHGMAAAGKKRRDQGAVRLPKAQIVLAGMLAGLLYLTDPVFLWIVPVIAGWVIWMYPQRRLNAAALVMVPMCVLMLPWMTRNAMLTNNPLFGLRGMEFWMNTKNVYPDDVAYRMSGSDIIQGVTLFKAVVEKVLIGIGTVIQAFPQITASWVLAFFLPCLLFQFTDPAANSVRRVMMYCLLALLVGNLVFLLHMPVFVAIVPTMLVFSVAYLLHLTQQAKLRTGSLALVCALVGIAIGFPLVSDVAFREQAAAIKEGPVAAALSKVDPANPGKQVIAADEAVLSDQPWIVAWFADRPSVWTPASGGKVADYRKDFPKMRWMFLTAKARSDSPEWQAVFDGLYRWDESYKQAILQGQTLASGSITGTGSPLISALDGFAPVPPDTSQPVSAVVAVAPAAETRIGMRSDSGGDSSR